MEGAIAQEIRVEVTKKKVVPFLEIMGKIGYGRAITQEIRIEKQNSCTLLRNYGNNRVCGGYYLRNQSGINKNVVPSSNFWGKNRVWQS